MTKRRPWSFHALRSWIVTVIARASFGECTAGIDCSSEAQPRRSRRKPVGKPKPQDRDPSGSEGVAPFRAQDPHHDEVLVRTFVPGVATQTPLLLETAGLVRVDRALVVGEDVEVDLLQVALVEGVVEQDAHRLGTEPLSPVLLREGDPELAVARHLVEVEELAAPDQDARGFDREARSVTPALAGVPVEIRLETGEGLRLGGTVVDERVDVVIVVVLPEPRKVLPLDRSQDDALASQHAPSVAVRGRC